MTIAEKIARAKADYDEVYEEGKAIGYAEGKTDGLAEGIEQGKSEAYAEFWDAAFETFNTYGTFIFAGSLWNDRTFNPNRSIIAYQGEGFFRDCRVENLKGILERNGVIFDFSNCTNFDDFAYASYIKYFPTLDCSNSSRFSLLFAYSKCESIHLIISDSGLQKFIDTFSYCTELVELIIEGGIIGQNGFNVQWSTKLSHESLMSIINALKDNSGTDTWNSITLGADNIAKLTQEELDIMEQKQWEYT